MSRYVILNSHDIRLAEVPGHLSLTLFIGGCPQRCPGCHSPELQTNKGMLLTPEVYTQLLHKYATSVSCILFMGGDWDPALVGFLRIARKRGLKTALYSGQDLGTLDDDLLVALDYLKYGPFVQSLGGLHNPLTNQRLIEVSTGKCLNQEVA